MMAVIRGVTVIVRAKLQPAPPIQVSAVPPAAELT